LLIERSPAWYEPADMPVRCANCRQMTTYPVEIVGGPEMFCDTACLSEWVEDHMDEAVKRLRR